MFAQELVSQDLACLTTPSHGIDIHIGKGLLADGFRFVAVGEANSLVFEDALEKVVLDILAPQRFTIIFLQVSQLIPTIDGGICCTSRRRIRLALSGRAGSGSG